MSFEQFIELRASQKRKQKDMEAAVKRELDRFYGKIRESYFDAIFSKLNEIGKRRGICLNIPKEYIKTEANHE